MLYEFFHIWHVSIGSIGCLANLLLCYVALFKTPKATRSYATFILNFAITDFAECFLDLFLQPRHVREHAGEGFILTPVNGVLIYVFHGFCQFTGPMSCKIGVSVLLHCFPHSAWSLLLSFTYRYFILHHPPIPRKILVLIILLVYTPSLFQALTFWTAFVDRERILPLADSYFPNYNLSTEDGVLMGVTSIKSFPVMFLIIHLCVPIFPIYIIIFIMRAKIVKNLMEKAAMMSQETRASHKQILKCLTIQAFIPTLFVITILCYIVAQLGILTHPILEYTIYAAILPMPMLSPFTYLVFVRPYRLFCRRLLTLKTSVGQTNRSVRFESTAHGSTGGSAKKYTVPPNS